MRALPPDPQSLRLGADLPSVIRSSYTIVYSTRLAIQTFLLFNFWFNPFPFSKILFKCQTLATASDLPFYDIFVLQKVPLSKNFHNVMHAFCGLPLPPPLKNPGYD